MTVDQATRPRYDDWADDAACRGEDLDLFFPLGGGIPAETRALCAACPVRADCLHTALTRAERGIWAGTTEAERRWMRAGKHPAPEPDELEAAGEPVTIHAVNPPTTTTPAETARPVEPVGILNLETLLSRAEQSTNATTRNLAEKTRAALDDLRDRVTREAAEREIRGTIAELEEKLAAERARLADVAPKTAAKPRPLGLPDGVTPKTIRAWAADNGVDCPTHGRIPKNVTERYCAAHGIDPS